MAGMMAHSGVWVLLNGGLIQSADRLRPDPYEALLGEAILPDFQSDVVSEIQTGRQNYHLGV